MNRSLLWLAAGSFTIFTATLASAAGPPLGAINKGGKHCGECHAIPPGTGQDKADFKPGSHAEHAKFGCERCHPVGENEITEAHVNGTISLKPEIEYQYGTEIPWPSQGNGTCGGLGYPYPPTGCHERMPDATCVWVPGKKCLTQGTP